jgi:hypothetical protein
LHNALKDLSLTYLRNKVTMSSNTKITYRTEAGDKPSSDNSRTRAPRKADPKQEAWLQKKADEAKKEVLATKSSFLMKKLNPADRRLVHQYIEKDEQFKSSSIGDGRFKQVEISLA